jgi:hypothetical protein
LEKTFIMTCRDILNAANTGQWLRSGGAAFALAEIMDRAE